MSAYRALEVAFASLEARLEQAERGKRICPFCCQCYIPEPENRHKDRCAGCLRVEQAERNMMRVIAQQLTPLDVAVTHIAILRQKGDEYDEQARANVAAIVESHVKEARSALFAALASTEGEER